MGFLFNEKEEVEEKVKSKFGDLNNHLVSIKHNDFKSSLLKLIISNIYYIVDNSRSFILYFSTDGIYEKEISNTMKGDFILIPWNEISSFNVIIKSRKAIIELVHIGKKIGYEIPFSKNIYRNNKNNLTNLQNKNWNRI